MIKEAKPQGYYTDKVFTPADIDKAVAAEREACAKVCDTEWDGDSDTFEHAVACNECAEAIRARGQQ